MKEFTADSSCPTHHLPCLDVRDGQVVKGRAAFPPTIALPGDILELAARYIRDAWRR